MEGDLSAAAACYVGRAYVVFSSLSTAGALDRAAAAWAAALVPLMKVVVVLLCLVMSVMLIIEKLSMALVAPYVKVFRRTPEIYKWVPLSQDAELGSLAYPMVLVQIPMFNEREVYQMSIGAVCTLAWPDDRLIIQVLDDSTDITIRMKISVLDDMIPVKVEELVQEECEKWHKEGRNIHYRSRDSRNGYEAGALKEAMELDYVKKCDYVAIFDADHEPPPEFLMRTIPFLMHNPALALVQARWKFGESSITGFSVQSSMQKVSLLKRLFSLYNFFFARRIVSHNVTFFFYCIVIPVSSFFPEVVIPKWGVFYIPTVITLLNSIGTPRSLHLIVIWIFFENVMSLHRFKAVFIDLLEAGRAKEWVVTEKQGDASKTKQASTAARKLPDKIWKRFLLLELGMGVLLLTCACYDCTRRTNQHFIFPRSLSFFMMGFGFVGTSIPPAQ